MPDTESFVYQKLINAPADLIYRAFTSSAALREWLCDISTTNPTEGGWIYLAWNRGYFASGKFTKLVQDQSVEFEWIGTDEPAWTQVRVNIIPAEKEGTFSVTLEHVGIGDDPEWDKSRKDIDKGWKLGMENLRSTLEEGRDLRVIERPLIGIYPEDFSNLNDSARDALNVPVDFGVLVSDVVPGFGAEKAGIQKGDLIVAIDDVKVDRIRSLGAVINEYQAGDQIKVDIFRGNEKRTLIVDTKTQSVKALPDTPEELAKHLEGSFSEELEKLEKVLEGVTDAEASYSPGDGEWSAKETLVHLIHSEREQHSWINDLVSGQERFYDEWPGDPLYRIRATLTTYPTIDDLLAEFRRSLKETVATVAFLDHTFTRRKASYWRLGTELLGMPKHIQEHIKQIEDNINAARRTKPE